ncbi:MAG: winged helix DNA-binding domain-containing protein [Anaerolineae bacterium]|nr:winged helix DNA-binding domain-containing protein [Anaerolineae bacterium]
MTLTTLVQQRLSNQRISATPFTQPVEVVHWLGAVQAQDYAGAKWALGLRLQNATDHLVEQAFNSGDILRTHLLRPTWHFVTPTDIRWLLALTAPRVHAVNGTMYRQLKLDNPTLKQSNDVLARVLQNGRYLTRDELRPILQNVGIATDNNLRMTYIMMNAELDGVVCSGPRRGKQFTYALLDERAPQAKILAREEALAELTRRYFASRGPATIHDFAKWSGLTLADARRGLEAVKNEWEQATVNGQTYWFPPAVPFSVSTSLHAHLLSIYDEYISGYKDRSAMVTAVVGDQLIALGNALYYIMVIDGQVIGSWKRTLHKEKVVIETNPFSPLTNAQEQAIVTAVQQYGAFLGLTAELA